MDAPRQKDWTTNRYRKVRVPDASELEIHASIVAYLRQMARPEVQWWHVPNGGARERVPIHKADGSVKWWCPSGKSLKKLGAIPGAPDLMFRWRASLDPLQQTLDIEVKRNGGKQSEEQKAWEARTVATGGHYYVVRSLDEAIGVFERFGITRPRQAAGRQ